jgi:hypothetical protein
MTFSLNEQNQIIDRLYQIGLKTLLARSKLKVPPNLISFTP